MFVHILNDRGIARVVCRVSSALARARVDVSIVCIQDVRGAADGLPVLTLGSEKTGKLGAIREFSRALTENDFDVAFAHGEGPSRDLVLARVLGGSGTPIVLVCHIHRSTHPRRLPWLQDGIASLLYPRADLVAGVSPGVVDDLVGLSSRIEAKSIVLPNPGPDTVAGVLVTPDHPWLADPELEVVVSVGHLNPRKGHEATIEAFRSVHDRRPRARLLILGAADDRNYHQHLLRLVDGLGLTEVVAFLHDVDNALPYIAAADLLVHMAKSEAFGLVILEALAAGTPVVAADSPGGAAWLLDHGRFGVLVPLGAPDHLADEVVRILDSPEERERLSDLGMRRAEDFSETAVARRYVETAHGLIGSTVHP